jgi:hypothetical protein
MAPKLVPLNDAAQQLGVSPDELNEMRQRQEIYGYRDGTSWKFKLDDVERLKQERAERAAGGGESEGSFVGDFDTLPVNSSSDEEVVLLSELELGESGPSTSSTIIGQKAKPDSDLKISQESQTGPESDVKLATFDEDVLGGSSPSGLPVDLADSATIVKSGSAVPLLDESVKISTGSGIDSSLGTDSGISMTEGSGLGLAADSGLGLADDELKLSSGGSSIKLGGEDDDQEDVLGEIGPGSDITHRPSDSGILLIDPSDSGLSLDKPLDLSSGSDAMLGATASFDSGSDELKADDDFLLTPMEEATDDESDSGSQVIMLDTEGEFEDATATLLASQIPGLGASMLEEESPLGGTLTGDNMGRVGGMGAAATAPAYTGEPVARETPYSAFSVLGLAACTALLAVSGMMMYDLIRNMWSWNSAYGVNSFIMDTLLGRS